MHRRSNAGGILSTGCWGTVRSGFSQLSLESELTSQRNGDTVLEWGDNRYEVDKHPTQGAPDRMEGSVYIRDRWRPIREFPLSLSRVRR